MTKTVLTALLSHWKRKPFQFVTLILGLALATALWSGVQAINAEARKSYGDAAEVLGGGGLREITRTDGAPIDNATYITLRRNGWRVSPVIDGWIDADQGRVRLLGIDPLTAPRGTQTSDAVQTAGTAPFLAPDGAILVAPTTAARLTQYGNRVEVIDTLAPGVAIVDLAAAQILVETTGYSRLLILPDQPLNQAPLSDIAPDLQIKSPQTADDLGRLTDSFHLNLTAFGLLSFAVGLFIVNGAVGLAFEQRRPVFRTLRALGVTARMLVLLLTVELLIFALVAGVLGIALGYVIAGALLPDVAATLRGLYGASVEGTLTLSPLWWGTGIAIAVLGTGLASATGLWRVARLAPLAAARPRAWSMAGDRAMRGQLLLAGFCGLVALGAGLSGGGLLAGFLLLGALLVAAALVLPSILALVLGLAARSAQGPVTEWFWADTRQQLPGLSLALMALLLALAANIGVGTMVESFRLTFTGWLDQRLASELYITVENDTQEAQMRAALEGQVDAILPIWNAEGEVLGAPAELYGIVDHSTYRDNWPLLSASPDVWDRLAHGDGVLINEQLARREGLQPGDSLPLPGGHRDVVVGVYSDYGNPLAQVILPNDMLIDRYDTNRGSFGLRVAPGKVETVKSTLRDIGLSEDQVIDQSALKAFSLDVFERTFAVTGALNVLTLAVAGVAILTSLLTLAAMRLPQLAPVWAIGLTRKRLGRIELIRAVILAALTFVLAIPVGLLLAWVLLAVINVEAFGWRLPMHLFPADWVWLGLLSLLAAALAGLWPARRLARRPPGELIAVFSHER